MGGIEQLDMAQPAKSTLPLIREDHSSAKDRLVQAPVHDLRRIADSALGHVAYLTALPQGRLLLVEGNHELLLKRLLGDEPHPPDRHVPTELRKSNAASRTFFSSSYRASETPTMASW